MKLCIKSMQKLSSIFLNAYLKFGFSIMNEKGSIFNVVMSVQSIECPRGRMAVYRLEINIFLECFGL